MKHINLTSWRGSITDWTELNYIKGGVPDNFANLANTSGNYIYYNANGKLEVEDNSTTPATLYVLKSVKVSDLSISVFNVSRKIWSLGDIADLNPPLDPDIIPNIYLYGFTTVPQNQTWTTGMVSVRNSALDQVYVCDTTYDIESEWYNAHINDTIYYW